MAREVIHQAIIIKRQSYGEGDEILTVFTREAGKLRVLAKSVKYSKSKLNFGLQTLFLVNLTVTAASAFPKVIGVEVVRAFANIRENLSAAERAFYALELLLKFTADEQKNESLFELAADFFGFLNSAKDDIAFNLGLAKFKIEFLENIGLGIHYEAPKEYLDKTGFTPAPISKKTNGNIGAHPDYGNQKDQGIPQLGWGFSNLRGGFVFEEDALDAKPVTPQVFGQFLTLKRLPFEQLLNHNQPTLSDDIKNLQDLLSGFIKYHLERDINSEKYLE